MKQNSYQSPSIDIVTFGEDVIATSTGIELPLDPANHEDTLLS